MTGPSSGDRPAEEMYADGWRAGYRAAMTVGTATVVATPPAVRTGDDEEHICLSCGLRGRHGFECPTRTLSTPPPVSGTVPTNAELAERAKSLDAHTVVRDWLARHVGHPPIGGFDTRDEWLNWAASNFLADPEIAQHLTPVSGTATRDDVARAEGAAAALNAAVHEVDDDVAAERLAELAISWEREVERLLALGGSQPAAQPVQPAEEQRPIDLLTEQGDEGRVWVQLPGEDVAFIRGFDPDRDRTASRADMVRVVEHLQAALDDGGDRG